MLVTNEKGAAEEPIIGDAIEQLFKGGEEHPQKVITQAVSTAFSFDCKKTKIFVRIIKASDTECSDGVVRMRRQKEVIVAGYEECKVLGKDRAPAMKLRSHFAA